MNHLCQLVIAILVGVGILYAAYRVLLHLLESPKPIAMDPVEAETTLKEVAGGFEPHLKRYQNLAQLILTLATATVAFLVNFLVHFSENDNGYSHRLKSACPWALSLLGLSAIFAITFIVSYSVAYEEYCRDPKREKYTPEWYAWNLVVSGACLLCFFFAYIFIGWRLIS